MDIIHYEDIQQNESCFINSFVKFLNGETTVNPYFDPDSFETKRNGDIENNARNDSRRHFYNTLTDFFNYREVDLKDVLNGYYIYFKPDAVIPGSYETKDEYVRKITITAFADNNTPDAYPLYLTSDQFGFSAYGNNAKEEKRITHAYSFLYALCNDTALDKANDLEEKNKYILEKYRIIADCVYNTRTIGGSFIWPKHKAGGNMQSNYNMQRGVGGYIEDRVDFTLLEVKHAYDPFYIRKYSRDILMESYVNLGYGEYGTRVLEWLKHFGTFKNYIDFFMLNDFVSEDYVPIDIINSVIDDKNPDKDKINKLPDIVEQKKYIRELYVNKDIHKIEGMLKNVRNLILRRSVRITEYLDTKAKKG